MSFKEYYGDTLAEEGSKKIGYERPEWVDANENDITEVNCCVDNKKAVGLMAQLMKLCQQHLSCLRRCFCFSS